MKIKFITAIFSDLYGTELGGRIQRSNHYRWSLLSLLKMTDADFICYTSERELNSLISFFYEEQKISEEKLRFVVFDLNQTKFWEKLNQYKNIEETKRSDRCVEIQYSKFHWWWNEDSAYDYYYWIDAGLSHCGLIPPKHLSLTGPHAQGFYESHLFNNNFLKNLIKYSEDKFFLIAKENQRNYWAGPVNSKWYKNFDTRFHIIGGLFGGKKELWDTVVNQFEDYLYKIIDTDNYLPQEENVLTLLYFNHIENFKTIIFDTWWHEEERLPGIDMIEHTKNNKSFYKILEELNNL